MENQEQNIRSWDDLIFENRNKAYGAYALRQDYSTGLIKGVLTSIGVAIAVLIVAGFGTGSKIIENLPPLGHEFEFKHEPKILTEVIPPSKPKEPIRPVSQNLPPVAVTTPDPVESKPEPVQPPTGTEGTNDGTTTSNTGTSISESTGTDLETGVVKSNATFTRVEVMPAYKNGMEGMMRTLRRHMRYPKSARQMGKEGTVYVEFVVSDEGEIRDVKVLTGFDKDCDKEAVRIVEELTEWTPGLQNKMAVNVKLVLPIKFKIDPM